MQPFTYFSPTEVVFGPNTQMRAAEYVRRYSGNRALIVYGGGSAVRSGLLNQICQVLKDARIPCETFGGAKANPTVEHAREGIRIAGEFGADFILGVGGGSAIDTAKAIAIGSANPSTDIWDYWEKRQVPSCAFPVGVVLTIPAAGSETSSSAVLTNTAAGKKRGLNSDWNRPKFAILNPELTFTLPAYQIACGITDIMMHTMDRYFNPIDNELTDSIAEALLRTVIEKGRHAIQNPLDYDSMSELMWAGSLSHNDLTELGGLRDFAVHQLGHELSAMFDTAHGASLATVWDSWALAVYQEKPERFARFAKNVWGIAGNNTNELALAGIRTTADYFRSVGMPTSFGANKDIGIQDEAALRALAFRCTYQNTRTIGTFKVLDESQIYMIYQNANH